MLCRVLGYSGGTYAAGGACPGYFIQWEEGNILLDMGSGVLGRLDEVFPLDTLKNIYISHFHYDHYGDLGVMIHHRKIQHALGKTKNKLDVYCPLEEPFVSLYGEEDLVNIHPLLGEKMVIDGAEFSFWKTKHSKLCYACRIDYHGKSLVYTADTGYSKDLVMFAKNADLLISECSIPARFPKQEGHMRLDEVTMFIEEAKVKKALLTHLPFYEPLSQDAFSVNVPLFLAEKHLVLQIE